MMTKTRIVVMAVVVALSTSVVLADYPELYDYYWDGEQWHYHYSFTVEGSVPTGYWWELDELAQVVEVGTPAGDWEYSFTANWVRWVYVGESLPDEDEDYVFATFDVASLAPPSEGRIWRSGTDGEITGQGYITGPVPEPSTVGLLLMGLTAVMGAAGAKWRQRA